MTQAVGKRRAQCPHNLPTALSPTVPLNLPKTDHQSRDDRMRKAVWVGKGKKAEMKTGGEGCTSRADKDVREINHQRNEKFLSSFTYCASKV